MCSTTSPFNHWSANCSRGTDREFVLPDSERPHVETIVKIPALLLPSSITMPTILTIVGTLIALYYFYVRRKCPYLVRGSVVTCCLCYVFRTPMLFQEDSWTSHTVPSNMFLLLMMLSCLLFRFFNVEKLDYVRDMSDDDGDAIKVRNPGSIPPVFPNGWIPILESRDLPVRSAKSVSALGQVLAVFRAENGVVYVLDAYCPHLGANLAIGGSVSGRCLECPFHGWKFDGDSGKCVHIPYAEKVPEVAKIRTWDCCEQNGFVYIWHHAEGEEPSWHMPQVQEIADGKWTYRGRTEHVVHCHIQELAENGADVAHLHHLHAPAVFNGSDIRNCVQGWASIKHEWNPKWRISEEFPHMTRIYIAQHLSFLRAKIPFSTMEVDVRQIGPAMVYMYMVKCLFGRGIYLMSIVPEEPMKQRIIHHCYTDMFIGQWLSNMLLKAEATMLERDIMVWNNKKFLRNPLLVKGDNYIRQYRRWYSQFYSDNSPTLKNLREKSLDW